MRRFSLLLLLVLLNMCVPSVYSFYCAQHDQSSLLQLKHSLVYDVTYPSRTLDSWNSSSDCCVWDGVTCSPGGDVIGLDLSYQLISGGIDDAGSPLFDLRHLQRLDLSGNNFNGTQIPSGIGKLVNLLYLDLSRSGFGGQVPIEMSRLTRLTTLNLSKVYSPDPPTMELEIPNFSRLVKNLTSLTELKLEGVNMSSDSEWGNALSSSLPNLRVLMLSGCALSGSLHDSLDKLRDLTSIDMSFNKLLSGTLPEFIGNMTKLQSVLLHDCGFSGSITHIHWENLGNLSYLDLSDNVLNGSIPLSLFSLPSLQVLYLSSNRFSGELGQVEDTRNLNLRSLYLDGNKLEGPIPKFIFSLVSLESLILSHNNLSGYIDLNNISQKLSNLSALDLSFNGFSIIETTVTKFSAVYFLRDVNLASCNLKEFPSFLRNLVKIYTLDLSQNHIHGLIPDWIWRLAYFTSGVFDLSHNSLIGFETLPPDYVYDLYALNLKSNLLQGHIPLDLGNSFPRIAFLSLANNNFSGDIPPSLCNLGRDYEVVVDLSNNSLSGTIPPCLFATNLGVLDLKRNHFSGSIPDAFPGNCSFQTLDLSQNRFRGTLPKSMVNCKALKVINLGNNGLTGVFPCWLKLVSNLTVLVLRSNRFYGSIRCALSDAVTNSWSKLQIIDIAANNFGGQLVHGSFRNWSTMMTETVAAKPKLDYLKFGGYYQDTVTIINKGVSMELEKILIAYNAIDFSCNHFEGTMPSSMGDLAFLYALNLSHNHFTGPIPPSIGNLKEMESLDLANNSLSGVIPEELAGLTFISYLNLSFNHLVGKIPTSTQLQSFPESSYIGNKGLYGPPLKTNCVTCGPHDPSSASGEGRIGWPLICIEMGYAVGLGSVIGSLMYWKRWRVWYFELVDGFLFKAFPLLDPHTEKYGRRVRKRSQMRIQGRE